MARKVWIPIVAVAMLALAGAGGAYAYFFSGLRTSPSSLALSSPSASPSASATATSTGGAGTWQVTSGALVGYRGRGQFRGPNPAPDAGSRTNDGAGGGTTRQTRTPFLLN